MDTRVRWIVLGVALAATACGGKDAPPAEKPANRPPAFPAALSYQSESEMQRDGRGTIVGAITTLTTTSRATDPDGDSLTYRWEGVRYNGDTLLPVTVDGDRARARFRSGVILGQAAGGILRLIARDPSGQEAVAQFCISGGGFSC
jgi:hypothetical protein